MSTTRVLRDSGAVLSHTFYADGTATAADGTVTVSITKADGTTLTSGNATAVGSTYTFVLADQPLLDRLTVTWTGTFSGVTQAQTDIVEIVGGFYVTLAEIRALPNLSDTAKFTTAELVAARTWFETTFERATGVAWVPRYARDRISGNNRAALLLPRYPLRIDPVTGAPVVYSVRTYTTSSAYTALTSPNLADLIVSDDGLLRRFDGTSFTSGYGNLVVEYEHGHESPPADVVEAAKAGIRAKLVDDQTGNRVFAVQTDEGIVRHSSPGSGRPFGIPFVDEIAAAHDHRVPAVA